MLDYCMQYQSFVFLLSHAYIFLLNSHIRVLYFLQIWIINPHIENYLSQHSIEDRVDEDEEGDDGGGCYTEGNSS